MLEKHAVVETVARAQKAIAKLTNGAGKVSTCPAHEPMADCIVCIGQMMIPVYQQAALEHNSEVSEIKSRWFTARGAAAMLPVGLTVCVGLICYTIIKLYGH